MSGEAHEHDSEAGHEPTTTPTLDRDTQTRLAKGLFNATWELIEKANRTAEDDEKMILRAYASRYHWGEVGEAVQFARGEWLLSRVHVLAGRAEGARLHGEACLRWCEQGGLGAFDTAFAHEALARAAALAGDEAAMARHVEAGREAADGIEDEGDRAYVLGELGTIEV